MSLTTRNTAANRTTRRTVAATVAGLAIAATAAAGLSSAQAAGPQQQHLSPAVTAQAPAGQAAANFAAATMPTAKVTQSDWMWPGSGSLVQTKELKATSAKFIDYYNAGRLSGGRVPHTAGLAGALPNGDVVVSKDGKVYITKDFQSKRLFSQTFEYPSVWTVGSTVYVKDVNNRLYSGTAKGGKAKYLGTLKGDAGVGAPAISGGRVFWTQKIKSGKDTSAQVVSRSLKGGSIRVESKHSRDPQAMNGGVLVQRITPARVGDVSDLRLGALGLIKAPGKVTQVLEAATVKTGTPAFPTMGLSVRASGDTVAISDAGKAGQIIVNLKKKVAWRISMPKGQSSIFTEVSGNRVVWTGVEPVGLSNFARTGSAYVFDSAKGKLSEIGAYGSITGAAINGDVVSWTDTLSDYRVTDANSLKLG